MASANKKEATTSALEEALARSLAQALYMEEGAIDVEKPFLEIGLDSIIAVEWINSLNKQYAINVKADCIYDYPTIRQLAGFLQKECSIQLYSPQEIIPSPLPSGGEQDGQSLAASHMLQVGHQSIEEQLALLEKELPKPTLRRTETYSVILAPNPSPLTGAGTNTIVLGDQRTGALVIDPATDDPAYLSDIIQEGQRFGGIRRILITHGHPDHIGGASALRAQLGVPLLAFSSKHVPFADEEIADNTLFPIGDDMLRALYTPGHCFDHLCFWLEKQHILFAGDLVTSHGPTLIFPPSEGDLQAYMDSLARIQHLASVEIIPAHGESILRPQELLAACLARCQRQKQQILALVQNAPGGIDIQTIVQALYRNVDASLYDFISSNVLSNLFWLQREGKVKRMEHQQSEQKDDWILI